jgi:hypothetical protein
MLVDRKLRRVVAAVVVGLELMMLANTVSSGEAMVDQLAYRLSAGPPGERLSVDLHVPRTGNVRLVHLDELYGHAASEQAITVEEDWRQRVLAFASALGKPDDNTGIPPDGLVRQIEITDHHGQTTRLTVGAQPPPAVRQLVETLDAWLAEAGVQLDQ